MTDDFHRTLHHVAGADLRPDTAQTPGMRRVEAISGRTVGARALWMGRTQVAAGSASADHHHGASETAIYVVSGNPEFVFLADDGTERRHRPHPGDYVFVPPYVPHREENPDPDHEAVVVIARSTQEAIVVNLPSLRAPGPVTVAVYEGPRTELRPLFELADDSPAALDAYLDLGRVLVARSGDEIVGHLQVVPTDRADVAELKNMAVLESHQGRGVGRALVSGLIDLLGGEAVTTLVVATAAADVGNLRFYQRQGFRMRAIERDAFTPATGYPPDTVIDGLELRDRVWLDLPLAGTGPAR